MSRINLGQAFAEYDKVLTQPNVFVRTPALQAALETSRSKCFFVGRRGTGKTAITYYLSSNNKHTIQIHPQIFISTDHFLDNDELRDTRRPPFRSLISSFRRTLQDEVIYEWVRRKYFSFHKASPAILKERNIIDEGDFDLRLLLTFEDAEHMLRSPKERDWVKHKKHILDVAREMDTIAEREKWDYLLLIDRIDEAWDGTDRAVIFLMALMHACVELAASVKCFRPLLFLRENVFERVRQIDNEFARLETCVVSLD
jgi:hypothetical protein